MLTRTLILLLGALSLPAVVTAQNTETFKPGQGQIEQNPSPVKLMCWNATTLIYERCPAASGGGGGGGTSDATAANQVIGNSRLSDINTTLGSPLQTNGLIGNTAFGVSGLLPAFASTPAVQGDPNGVPLPVNQRDGVAVTTATAGSLNAVLFTADTIGYRGVAAQIGGALTGTITFQGSNDNTTWTAVMAQSLTTSTFGTTAVGLGNYVIPAHTRYVRAIITAYTSGSVTTTAVLRQTNVDQSPPTTTVSGTVTTSNNPTIGPGGNTIGNFQRAVFFTETPTLTANGTTTGASRANVASGTYGVNNMVTCFFRSDQASATNGAQLQGSNDGFTTNAVIQSLSLPASAAGAGGSTLTSRVYFAAHRCVLINGATAATDIRVALGYGE